MQLGGIDATSAEVVYEFTPDPAAVARGFEGAGACSKTSKAAQLASQMPGSSDGIDTRSTPARDALDKFAGIEDGAVNTPGVPGLRSSRREFEAIGDVKGLRQFEPPDQRVARLQAEVADLLKLAECPPGKGVTDSAELLGGDPAAIAAELKVLERRLGGLARDGPPAWHPLPGGGGEAASGPMAQSLVSRLDRLATGQALAAELPVSGDGRFTYEINYAPSSAALADSSKLAALEGSVAEVERRLGGPDPASPFPDLQSAISQLHKRLSLLDGGKLDAIRGRVEKVMGDVDAMLIKKAELLKPGADDELDEKVKELYEFCHRWTSTAASLPAIVARLRSLQALHQQSATFSARLAALEQQQDELTRLLDTTNAAVQELGKSLQENMTVVNANMKSLEEKIKGCGKR